MEVFWHHSRTYLWFDWIQQHVSSQCWERHMGKEQREDCYYGFSSQSTNQFKLQSCNVWSLEDLLAYLSNKYFVPHLCKSQWFSCCRNCALKNIDSTTVKLCAFFQGGGLLFGVEWVGQRGLWWVTLKRPWRRESLWTWGSAEQTRSCFHLYTLQSSKTRHSSWWLVGAWWI